MIPPTPRGARFGLALPLLLVLAGFTGSTGEASTPAESPSCTRVEDYGAVPDDGADDRDAIQAAIDAAQAGPGCLELTAGTFHATRKQIPGKVNIPSLRITGPLALRGAGPGVTTLAMLGPGTCSGCQSFPNPTDWRLLDVAGAADVSMSGLTLDGSERTQTNEQTHLLQLTGPTQRVLIEQVDFQLPVHGPSSGGDCVRLLGTATQWVRDTTIRHATGIDCDRSFVGVQRGVDGLVVEHSESVRVGDQAIDFEPTGGEPFDCQPIVKNVRMRDLTLRRAATTGLTVAIAGRGCAVAENITLTDSVVEDGGVFVIDTRDVTLSGLHLRNLPGVAQPPLLVKKRTENLRVLDSVLERAAGSVPEAVVKVHHQSGAYPTDVLLSGVRIVQPTDWTPVSTKTSPGW